MALCRKTIVRRHNPVLNEILRSSPLSVGNGELAFTADITGMQTLYHEYEKVTPLCTMAQWGFHTSPDSNNRYHSQEEVVMTEYEYCGRTCTYPVEPQPGNEAVYHWLRQNPHRLNLARIGFLVDEAELTENDITPVRQELDLYTGVLESEFQISKIVPETGNSNVYVTTVCGTSQAIGFSIRSSALTKGIQVAISFPYGSPDISASDWTKPERHVTDLTLETPSTALIRRTLDKDRYDVVLTGTGFTIQQSEKKPHTILICPHSDIITISVAFCQKRRSNACRILFEHIQQESIDRFRLFWERGAMVDFSGSSDLRAIELERRIICSLYLTAIQCTGSMPPQETGLTVNSWYGKFHLEMHPFHSAYLPLWNRGKMLIPAITWYGKHLKEAKKNAERNGFTGARWPKMIGPDAVDSPSVIAPLLIWQQPHIIYMLELLYQSEYGAQKTPEKVRLDFLNRYRELITETAEFMCDYAVYNQKKKCFELLPPLIPAQENHAPCETKNPTFELAYWGFALKIACKWMERLGIQMPTWLEAARHMAPLPIKDGALLAHENAPDTYEKYASDHPSMLFAYGFLPGEQSLEPVVRQTVQKIHKVWDENSMWGWDFALMAMTEVRLANPEAAVDVLMKDSPKNSYEVSGNNSQRTRTDLPLYLPGNGSLLLAASMMIAGYPGQKEEQPGIPKNGAWKVVSENLNPYPF